ncbi:hypothetical protein ES703_47332 [subsurface metagenome]
MGNVRTELSLKCPCGAASPVFENKGKWNSHCVNCGRVTFWSNPLLTERVRYGGQLCKHKPEAKPCKNPKILTSFCLICRVRVFVPAS